MEPSRQGRSPVAARRSASCRSHGPAREIVSGHAPNPRAMSGLRPLSVAPFARAPRVNPMAMGRSARHGTDGVATGWSWANCRHCDREQRACDYRYLHAHRPDSLTEIGGDKTLKSLCRSREYASETNRQERRRERSVCPAIHPTRSHYRRSVGRRYACAAIPAPRMPMSG